MAAQHQYAVGDSVRYLSSTKSDYRAPGIYRIARLRPNEGADHQYWVRSALENFYIIASESELALIRPKPDARVSRRLVTIPVPFQLKGMEQETPAGEYEVTTTEEVTQESWRLEGQERSITRIEAAEVERSSFSVSRKRCPRKNVSDS